VNSLAYTDGDSNLFRVSHFSTSFVFFRIIRFTSARRVFLLIETQSAAVSARLALRLRANITSNYYRERLSAEPGPGTVLYSSFPGIPVHRDAVLQCCALESQRPPSSQYEQTPRFRP
jgi:hypothetical protein